jgi:hypothetical protein
MLSFQIVNSGKEIQVYCDEDGLDLLISKLVYMKNKDVGHIHLCSPSAGGKVLNDKTPWGDSAVPEVVITTN